MVRSLRAAIVLALAIGCTKSPESLCEHMVDVVGPDDPQHPEASRQAGMKRCIEVWSAKKRDDPKGYACYASCASDVKHLVDLASCKPKCFPNEPQPKDEPEKTEGLIWFPDAEPAPSASSASASASASVSASASPSASAAPSSKP